MTKPKEPSTNEVEWDPAREAGNRTKHGVSFAEAATVLADALSVTVPDHRHSAGEARFFTIGMSAQGRLLVVAYTERNDKIRIISSRPATRHERKTHEEKA
jgi:uncharacterized DUF497 family protein